MPASAVGAAVRVGDEVTRAPRFRATDTFCCPRCGCLLTLTQDTLHGVPLPPQEHLCCGLRFHLEVRVETVVVTSLDAGECPMHGAWPPPEGP